MLLFESVIAPAVVLSIVVPAAIAKLPVPKAVALLMFSVPAESVVPPPNVLAADKVKAALPRLGDGTPPLSTLPSATLFPLVSNVAVTPEPMA